MKKGTNQKVMYNRLQFMDVCVNGDIQKFKNLTSDDYERMEVAYQCAELLIRRCDLNPDKDIVWVDYNRYPDNISFDLHINPERYDTLAASVTELHHDKIDVRPETKSICIHISVI